MKLLPGYHLELIPFTFGRARIIETDGSHVARFWSYDLPLAAVAALVSLMVGLHPEPSGWIRAASIRYNDTPSTSLAAFAREQHRRRENGRPRQRVLPHPWKS